MAAGGAWRCLFLGALMVWAASAGAPRRPRCCSRLGVSLDDRLRHDLRADDACDHVIVGIKSTARLFVAHARLGVGLFYLLSALLAQGALLMVGMGFVAEFGWAGFARIFSGSFPRSKARVRRRR